MKTNAIEKSFTIDKILKIDFQNFHISWKGSKSISWAFLGSLHHETIAKYVFHEMLWEKYFTMYPRINGYNNLHYSMVRIFCLYRRASSDNVTRLHTSDMNKTIDLHIKFVYEFIALHQPQKKCSSKIWRSNFVVIWPSHQIEAEGDDCEK